MSLNSSGLPNTKLTLSPCDGECTPTTISKADTRKWAELIAFSASQMQMPPAHVPGAADTPEAWRSDVEVLTPSIGVSQGNLLAQETSGLSVCGSSVSSNESQLNRLQVRVNAGDLGELSLVVERLESGLHVRIGAEDSGVLAAMAKISESMTQALTSIGQPVTTLTFVPMEGVGINLAPTRLAMGNRARSKAAKTTDDSRVDDKRRKNRRIDVLG